MYPGNNVVSEPSRQTEARSGGATCRRDRRARRPLADAVIGLPACIRRHFRFDLLPPPRRLCFCRILFVCLCVSKIASGRWGDGRIDKGLAEVCALRVLSLVIIRFHFWFTKWFYCPRWRRQYCFQQSFSAGDHSR